MRFEAKVSEQNSDAGIEMVITQGLTWVDRFWYAACGMNRRLAAFGLLGVGFYVAACIILGIIGGHWLDGKMNSAPLWLIVGLLLGIVIAFYGVYAMLRPFLKDKQDKGNS